MLGRTKKSSDDDPDVRTTLTTPGQFRAVLKRLGVQVKVCWRRVSHAERAGRRKGRGHGCPGRVPE